MNKKYTILIESNTHVDTLCFYADEIEFIQGGVWATGKYAYKEREPYIKLFFPFGRIRHIKEDSYNGAE